MRNMTVRPNNAEWRAESLKWGKEEEEEKVNEGETEEEREIENMNNTDRSNYYWISMTTEREKGELQ